MVTCPCIIKCGEGYYTSSELFVQIRIYLNGDIVLHQPSETYWDNQSEGCSDWNEAWLSLYNSNHVCCAMLSFVTEAFYYLKDTVDHKSIFVSNNSSMSGGYRRNKYWISFLSAQNIWDALKYQLLVKLYLSAQVNLLFKNKPRYFTALTHSRVEPF